MFLTTKNRATLFEVAIFSLGFLLSYLLSVYSWYNLSCAVFIITSVILYLSLAKEYGSIVEPVAVFSLFWNGGMALSMAKLSKLQVDWEHKTWFLFFFIYLIFFIVYKYSFAKKDNLKQEYVKIGDIKRKRLDIIIVIITSVSVVSITIEALLLGFIPILSDLPHAYSYFHISGLHYFSLLFVFVPMLTVISSYDTNKSFLNCLIDNKVNMLCSIISFILPLILVSRFELLFTILFLLMTYTVLVGKINFKLCIIFLAIAVVGWVILTVFRNHSVNYLNKIFEMKNSNTPIFITQPYMYIANNYDNFNCLVAKLDEYAHGFRNLYPFLALSGLKFNPDIMNNFPTQIFITKKELTTLTIFYDYYYDFGTFGVLLASGFIAFISKLISSFAKIKRNPLMIIFLAQFNIYLLLSFFTTWFSNPTVIFNFVISFMVYICVSVNFKRK